MGLGDNTLDLSTTYAILWAYMGKFQHLDIKGKSFTYWVALERLGKNRHGYSMWLCECRCGTQKTLAINRLTSGTSKSCGCFKLEQLRLNPPRRGKVGAKHTQEAKDKISKWSKEWVRPSYVGKKISEARMGHEVSSDTRVKISVSRRGKCVGVNNHRWIKDRTKLKDDHKDRGGQLHREWSRCVKFRDGWRCKIADENCVGDLQSHHILSWSEFPELRYQVNNGITLCHAHHPRVRAEEKRLVPVFMELVAVSR